MSTTRRSVRGSRPRIVLDARPLSHPQAGGFRSYVRSLARGLEESGASDEVEILLYLDRPLPPDAPPLPPGMETRILGTSRVKTDLLLFRRQVRNDRPDLVHGTMNYLPPGLPAPSAVTIHDAMGIKRYAWDQGVPRTPRERLINRYWAAFTRLSARAARRVVTVSAFSAQEVASVLPGTPADRFAVVYNGLALPPPTCAGARDDNNVLALASPDPRKNLDALYAALSGANQAIFATTARLPRLDVVCTSAATAARTEAALTQFGITHFRLLRGLDDQALSNAYATASVFVWPSRMEGFGIPPLEAMSTGCPVLSSCAPAMPEVLGETAPVWFDPERPEELAARLAELLANREERQRRAELGKTHAARFTCRRMAEETLTIWRDCLKGAG